jgi:hypothetical protein
LASSEKQPACGLAAFMCLSVGRPFVCFFV